MGEWSLGCCDKGQNGIMHSFGNDSRNTLGLQSYFGSLEGDEGVFGVTR